MVKTDGRNAALVGKEILAGASLEGRRKTVAGFACLALFCAALASCATSADRWRSLASQGPLVRWAACMESDGYEAWTDAGRAAAGAFIEGATPLPDSHILRIGIEACDAFGAEALAALSPAAREQLYRDTERRLRRKLRQERGGD